MQKIKVSKLKRSVPVKNFLTKDKGHLVPLGGALEISTSDIHTIVRICNTPKVFDLLFKDLEVFKERRYEGKDAWCWINDLGKKGWREFSNFVFVVKNSKGEIVCAVDIKSNNINGSEIGYWADESNPGWMTNTIVALISLAKSAGYKKLFALVKKSNEASTRVLQRAGFIEVPAPKDKEEHYEKFEIQL